MKDIKDDYISGQVSDGHSINTSETESKTYYSLAATKRETEEETEKLSAVAISRELHLEKNDHANYAGKKLKSEQINLLIRQGFCQPGPDFKFRCYNGRSFYH